MVPPWQQHWFSSMTLLDGVVLQRVRGMTLVINPHVEGPLQNFALWREVVGDPQQQVVDMEACFAMAGRTPAIWLVPELAATVRPLLAHYQAQRLAVLWRDLETLPEEPTLPTGVAIRRVSPDELGAWAETLVACFGWTPFWQGSLAAAYRAAAGAGGTGYLAERDGEAVGCGWLQQTGELAGLYAGGVLPTSRGQGLGRALVLRRLHDARAQGALAATLQVEPGGPMARICRDLGFSKVALTEVLSRA